MAKLAVLQASDSRRKGYSLDDQRVCVLCARAIGGHQIEIARDPSGGYSLHCPTPDCHGLPNDWFYRGSGCSTERNAGFRRGEVTLWQS